MVTVQQVQKNHPPEALSSGSESKSVKTVSKCCQGSVWHCPVKTGQRHKHVLMRGQVSTASPLTLDTPRTPSGCGGSSHPKGIC